MGRLLGYLVCGAVWDLCLCVKALSPLFGYLGGSPGRRSGIHRCPGLRAGGGAPLIWRVTHGCGDRCPGPAAGGGTPCTWGLSRGVGTHRCPARAGGGTPALGEGLTVWRVGCLLVSSSLCLIINDEDDNT